MLSQKIHYIYFHGFKGAILKTIAYVKMGEDLYFGVKVKLRLEDYKSGLNSKKNARKFADEKLNRTMTLVENSSKLLHQKIQAETMEANKKEKNRRIRKSEVLQPEEIKIKLIDGLIKSGILMVVDYEGINDIKHAAMMNKEAIKILEAQNKVLFSKQVFENF